MTTDGDEKKRLKSGTGSWVYGEELSQTTAIWWSPDGTQGRDLPLRRKQGEGLLHPDGPDPGHRAGRHRGLSESRRRQSGAGSPALRPGRETDRDDRRARRQAVHQRRRRPLRLQRRLVARRHRVDDEPHESPAADHGVHRVQSVDDEVPRDRARGVEDGLGGQSPADAAARRQEAVHLGIRAQRLDELLPLRFLAAS